MLLDFGWSEILLIGVVALVVIGPKDLPKAMRVAGYWIRKARSMSHDFQMQVEQMMREAELDEVRDELKKAGEIDLGSTIRDTVDPDGSLADSLKPPELPDFSDRSEGEGEAQAEADEAAQTAASETAASETAAADTGISEPSSAEPDEIESATAASEEEPAAAAPNGAGTEPADDEREVKPASQATPPVPEPAAPHAAPPKPSE